MQLKEVVAELTLENLGVGRYKRVLIRTRRRKGADGTQVGTTLAINKFGTGPMPSALSRHRSVLSLKWILVAVAVAGAAASSLRPAVVVFWNDSPAFLLSALRTIESHFPTVLAGRDIGYPLFLAFWLDLTGTLESVVVAQQIIFVLIIAIVAFALVNFTNNIYYALFSVMLAMYPGLLIYKSPTGNELFDFKLLRSFE